MPISQDMGVSLSQENLPILVFEKLFWSFDSSLSRIKLEQQNG